MKAQPVGGWVQVCGREGHGEGKSLEEGREPLPLTMPLELTQKGEERWSQELSHPTQQGRRQPDWMP